MVRGLRSLGHGRARRRPARRPHRARPAGWRPDGGELRRLLRSGGVVGGPGASLAGRRCRAPGRWPAGPHSRWALGRCAAPLPWPWGGRGGPWRHAVVRRLAGFGPPGRPDGPEGPEGPGPAGQAAVGEGRQRRGCEAGAQSPEPRGHLAADAAASERGGQRHCPRPPLAWGPVPPQEAAVRRASAESLQLALHLGVATHRTRTLSGGCRKPEAGVAGLWADYPQSAGEKASASAPAGAFLHYAHLPRTSCTRQLTRGTPGLLAVKCVS
mmetsp:Transcript_112759/g.364024  ORF Transcript_112759/g.364024 Transcript_112759/m.364024 type:complete len:269 (+) Transcript_112759:571-1377(+)